MQQLQSALNLNKDSKYTTTQIHYSYDGYLRPLFSKQQTISNIEIPKIKEIERIEMDDSMDDTPSGSAAHTPIKQNTFQTQQKFDQITDENDKNKQIQIQIHIYPKKMI